MLQYEIAKSLYEEIREKAAKITDEELKSIYQDFLENAADYAKSRTA